MKKPVPFQSVLGAPAEVQLSLQRRAPRMMRRHLRRGVIRVSVLIVADLATFWILRDVYRLAVEKAWMGLSVANRLEALLPVSYLNGWQYALALVLGLALTHNYGAGDFRRDPGRLFVGCALATALPLWSPAWTRGLGISLIHYALTTAFVWLALLFQRLALDYSVDRVMPNRAGAPRTLLVGSDEDCEKVKRSPAFASRNGFAIVGTIDIAAEVSVGASPIPDQLPETLERYHVETVVVCSQIQDDTYHNVLDQAMTAGCEVLLVPHRFEVDGVDPRIVWHSGQPLVKLTEPSLKARHLAIKRVVDLVGAVTGLVLGSPLFLVLAALIRLDSRGPVFFRQQRVGLGGRPFQLLKFRTMAEGADEQKGDMAHLNHSGDPRLFKIPDDPRVTWFGRWLRRWSLDELPQLWNVLKGEMSLVGPRPFFEMDLPQYEIHHFVRLGAKPGITGLWQVSGRSDIVDFEEVVRLDREYVREWSIWTDVRVLVQTIPAVFQRRGAM